MGLIVGNKVEMQAMRRLDPHKAIAAIGAKSYEALYARMWRASQKPEGPWNNGRGGDSPAFIRRAEDRMKVFPSGWVTSGEVVKIYGMNKDSANSMLSGLLKRGLVERRRLKTSDGKDVRFWEWRKVE